MTNNNTTTDTVVLIHGLWMTPVSWENWVAHYEKQGLRVITPGYPGIGQGPEAVEAIRCDPSPLAGLGVQEVVDHLAEVIEGLDTKPIIMGHSFGGAFTELLVGRGYGSAGVSIDGGPVKGVLSLPLTTIRATLPVLANPLNRGRAVPITPSQFHYAFTNNLSEAESQQVYDRYAIPVSGRIVFQGGLANFTPNAATSYDFRNGERAPLLFVAGGNDHILPPAVQHENYRRNAKGSSAISAYKEFPGRSHYTCGEPGWEQVADFALAWAQQPVPGELP